MTYKTITVVLNEIERVPQLVSAATALASRFQAHVNGLYVVPGVEVDAATAYSAGTGINDTLRNHFLAKLPEVKSTFEKAMKAEGALSSFQTVEATTPRIISDVLAQSRAAELIVVSAVNKEGSMAAETDFVERLVIAAGRPVLVLPAVGDDTQRFDDIILAWDQSREASRAAFDSLPFLRAAKSVHVTTVDPPLRGEVAGASLAEALSRHGVNVQTLSVSSDGLGIGEALKRAAHDKGASIIVMGAYGHSRFAELVFGGATRTMIHGLDRAILMSH